MNMIEKVARAIFASQEWTEFSPAFEHQADDVWFPAAKAAIEAMRDDLDAHLKHDEEGVIDRINAALEEK